MKYVSPSRACTKSESNEPGKRKPEIMFGGIVIIACLSVFSGVAVQLVQSQNVLCMEKK